MRSRYLVSYDICHPKRLRRIAKICESYGSRLQYSVFECPLDGVQLERLKAELKKILHHEEDQVLFVHLGPVDSKSAFRIEAIGVPYFERSRVTIV